MLYVVLGLIFFTMILYIMPINISISIKNYNNNTKIILGFKTLYGLFNLEKGIPVLKFTFENGKPIIKYETGVTEGKRSLHLKTKELLRKYEQKRNIVDSSLKYIIKKIFIKNLFLKLGMGTDDAAMTGMLYGTAWIVIGSIMTLTGSHVNIKETRIVIVPMFGRVSLSIDFSCIISIKTGHIINAGIRAMPALISGNR